MASGWLTKFQWKATHPRAHRHGMNYKEKWRTKSWVGMKMGVDLGGDERDGEYNQTCFTHPLGTNEKQSQCKLKTDLLIKCLDQLW